MCRQKEKQDMGLLEAHPCTKISHFRSVDVDFNTLDINFNLETWVIVLDLLGIGAPQQPQQPQAPQAAAAAAAAAKRNSGREEAAAAEEVI